MAKRKARSKKRVTITRAAAVSRVDEMIGAVVENVEIAMGIKAAFQSANEIVQKMYRGQNSYEAHCYNVVTNSLALNLALALARLFDPGAKRFHNNKKDIASIPLMLRLLGQARCRKTYMERAKGWNPDFPSLAASNAATCSSEIDAALKVYKELKRHTKGRNALSALKEFRDKRLAHSLLSVVAKSAPRYGHLYLLTDAARDIAGHAKLAVLGNNLDLKDADRERRRQADAFWIPALTSLFSSTPDQRAALVADTGDYLETSG